MAGQIFVFSAVSVHMNSQSHLLCVILLMLVRNKVSCYETLRCLLNSDSIMHLSLFQYKTSLDEGMISNCGVIPMVKQASWNIPTLPNLPNPDCPVSGVHSSWI